MSFDNMFTPLSISGSGMRAERLRMEVMANNVANANATRTPEGGAYRRKEVLFETVLRDVSVNPAHSTGVEQLGGVKSVGIVPDMTEMPIVYNPGHPDADPDGYVTMPNVNLPIEMVNLVTASRAYEANLKVAQAFREVSDQAINLAKG